MKKRIKFGLVIALLLMAMSIFAHAYDYSETITDGVEFMSPNEALSYMAFMYNVSEITSFSPEDTVIYAYLTGQLEKGTDEYYKAQLVYLFTMYGAVNTNHDIANAKLEASRVSLEKYLTGKMGSNPDVAGVQEYVNGKLGGIKSTLKKIVVDLCGEGMEIAFATNNAFLNVLSAKDKAAAFIADMTAVLDAVKFINNRNMTMCYSYYTAYLYYRHWYDSGSTGPQIFGSLMEEFLLRNIGDLDGINIIFEKLGMHTWTDRDVQVLLGRFAEFAYHTEIEVNSYVDEIESIEVRSLPRTVYYLNQKLDLSGFSLLVTRKSGQTEIVSGFSLDKTFTQAGEYEITVPYGGIDFVIHVDVYYDGGKCGQVLEWFLDYKYTLHIKGKGAMTDYEQGTAPWYSYRWKIKRLSLSNDLTTIGSYAFYSCSGLTGNLVIPDSVTTIGNYAFKSCDGLTGNLVIPDGVTMIGDYAFEFCYGLTGNLVIGDRVTTIGDYAFAYCDGLTGNLVIPDRVTTIGERAFCHCRGLTGNLVIGDRVTTIGDGAFYYCDGLTGNLVIPDSVTTIGEWAFKNCDDLTGNLVIGDRVTTIGDDAFSDCDGFTGNLVIPDSVTTIGNSAFFACRNLTGNLVIGDSVTTIGDSAFGVCDGLTGNLVIGNSVTTIGSGAFRSCSGLTGNLVIPDSVTTIGDWAFYGCSGLTGNLVIPDGVTTIGDSAFGVCYGLTGNLVIPDSVTTIGSEAFYYCSGLTFISVSEANPVYSSLNGILYNKDKTTLIRAPGGMTGNLVIPSSVTTIGDSAFSYCRNLTGDLVIPSSVTTIGDMAFKSCDGLTGNLVISDSVTIIGYETFAHCSGLTGNLVIPDSVTTIGGGAFYNCSGLMGNLVIPDSVTTIESSAFCRCSGLTSVMLPMWMGIGEGIGDYAFDGCTSLTNIILPNSVMSIGWYTFRDCTALTDIYYNGSKAEWDAIYIDDSNATLLEATIHFCDGDLDGSGKTNVRDLIILITNGIYENHLTPQQIAIVDFDHDGYVDTLDLIAWIKVILCL